MPTEKIKKLIETLEQPTSVHDLGSRLYSLTPEEFSEFLQRAGSEKLLSYEEFWRIYQWLGANKKEIFFDSIKSQLINFKFGDSRDLIDMLFWTPDTKFQTALDIVNDELKRVMLKNGMEYVMGYAMAKFGGKHDARWKLFTTHLEKNGCGDLVVKQEGDSTVQIRLSQLFEKPERKSVLVKSLSDIANLNDGDVLRFEFK